MFVDLRKAFDCVDHKTLLKKLERYGIRGVSHNWFKSYLTNRSQCVKINGIKSEYLNICTGVPQGSILGPILFILFINDFPLVSQQLDMFLYADDTTICLSDKNYDSLIERVNQELEFITGRLITS